MQIAFERNSAWKLQDTGCMDAFMNEKFAPQYCRITL